MNISSSDFKSRERLISIYSILIIAFALPYWPTAILSAVLIVPIISLFFYRKIDWNLNKSIYASLLVIYLLPYLVGADNERLLVSFLFSILFLVVIPTSIDVKHLDNIFKCILITSLGVYLLNEIGVRILLFQSLFSIDQTDLYKFDSFRNPGIFDEPSTLSYIICAMVFYSNLTVIWRLLAYALVVSSLSVGGFLLLMVTVVLRERNVNVILFTIGMLLLYSVYNQDIISSVEYINFRLSSLLTGDDASLNMRLSLLPENLLEVLVFGSTIEQLRAMNSIGFISGLGTVANVFLHVGILGSIIFFPVVNNRTLKEIIFLILFITICKFNLIEPALILLLTSSFCQNRWVNKRS